jgi:imidazolonepropionase-like amidohydrolase
MRIINARIETMEGREAYPNGYAAYENGVITAVGPMDAIAPSPEDFDARGGFLMPGIVEAHCQLGLSPEGSVFEQSDTDEAVDTVSPQLCALDGIYPGDPAFGKALRSGVTTAVISPGSGNVVGGRIVAVKTMGSCADEMVFNRFVGMKLALGESVLAPRGGRTKEPLTRMGAAAVLRDTFTKAAAYADKKDAGQDVYDQKFEALYPIVRGLKPAYARVYTKDDILAFLRFAEQFRIEFVLLHAFGCAEITDILREKHARVIAGPLMSWDDRGERKGVSPAIPKLLYDAGIEYAISMFSASGTLRLPVPPWFNAAHIGAAVREGLPEGEALRAVTINAARLCGIEDRVGSIKLGKDADFVLYDGKPMDYRTKVVAVWCNGVQV